MTKQIIQHYRIQTGGQNQFFRTKKEALDALPYADWNRDAYLYQGCYSCDADGILYHPMGREYLLGVRET